MMRLPAREIREVMRLAAQGLSSREIAASTGVDRTTLREYLGRVRSAGLTWPLPDGMSDGDLERLLFPRSARDAVGHIPQPDWAYVHTELRRTDVTLVLLSEEYRTVHPDGYRYSRYCELYTRWEGRLSPAMRQRYAAGEALFVDYAGTTIDIVCPETGEVRAAQLLVAAARQDGPEFSAPAR